MSTLAERVRALIPDNPELSFHDGKFLGAKGYEDNHSTTGGRAWNHIVSEWCYPDSLCLECHPWVDPADLEAVLAGEVAA